MVHWYNKVHWFIGSLVLLSLELSLIPPYPRSLRYSEALRPATLLKKRLWHRCFLVNFAKFLRTLFLQNISGRLLPDILILFLGSHFTDVLRRNIDKALWKLYSKVVKDYSDKITGLDNACFKRIYVLSFRRIVVT